MKNPVDVATTLEADADKLPDLVFSKTGELLSGGKKAKAKRPKSGAAKPSSKPARGSR